MDLNHFHNNARAIDRPLLPRLADRSGQKLSNPGYLHNHRSPAAQTTPTIHYYLQMVKHTLTKLAGLLV
jgi:hypothetical protein